MSTVDFSKLLSKPAGDIKRPPNFPAGTFFAAIKDRKFDDNNKNKTPYVRFTLGAWEPGNDVDASQLEGIKLDVRTMTKDFYLTPDAEWRVVELARQCGLQIDGKSLAEVIEDLKGQRVLVEMKLVPNRDNPEESHNEIGNLKGAA
jgi:hypothetical protein